MIPESIVLLDDAVVENKRERLESVLRTLSNRVLDPNSDAIDYNRLAKDLESVYSDGYRQMYSEIYMMLDRISSRHPEDLETLLTNLDGLRRYVGEHNGDFESGLYGHLLKLYDHVNIEAQRHSQVEYLEQTVETLKGETQKIHRDIKTAMGKVRSIHTESVTILGIFAAIVVAFTAGVRITEDSVSDAAGLPELSYTVALCGIVLFDVVAMLMWKIEGIVNDWHSDTNAWKRWLPTIAFNVLMLAVMVWAYCQRQSTQTSHFRNSK